MNAITKSKKSMATVQDLAEESTGSDQPVRIARPKFRTATIQIVGTSPLVLHKFSEKAKNTIKATQEAGSQSRKGRTREARDFEANFQAARHLSTAGWDGFPASAIRNAMISACRVVGFKMTLAKLSVFCVADGYSEDGTGLVRIFPGNKTDPVMDIRAARNANGGTDLRARPMWQPGWTAAVQVRWDEDQFSSTDIANLLARAGMQVGLGEGRPDSHMSAGVGWGEFALQD